MLTNILDIRKLSVDFVAEKEVVHAVNQISFSIGKGEVVGLVGESGSGKSVTALSLMKLLPSREGKIKSGQILFNSRIQNAPDGVDLVSLNENAIRKIRGKEIAMIFQEPMVSMNPVLSCGVQVTEAIRTHYKISAKEGKFRTLELFKKVFLSEPDQVYKSFPHQLSGGQKQRVMIAMAISCDPQVLIADEPTTALDVTVQASILKLLKNIQEANNTSMLFISHDLGVISEIANRVLVMYKGQIVEHGPVKELFRNPVHPYTRGLLACRPFLGSKMKRLPEISNFMDVDEQGTMIQKNLSVDDVRQSFLISSQSEEEKIRQSKMYMNSPLLKVEDLTTRFTLNRSIFSQKKQFLNAVDGISFDVYPGETLGLVGESGCGKTTLGRTILRLIKSYTGSVKFKGLELFSLSSAQMRLMRRQMQMIFQDPYSSLNPRLTIGETIMEPMQVHQLHGNDHKRKEKVMELLEKVNMNAIHFNRYPHEFSGGQRQRIAIARTLAVEPGFIICDEPVSALDVSVQAQVLNLLNDLKREYNLSLIFISHDLSVVKFMSDRMIIMNKGKIEEMGYPDDIYNNPSSAYTSRLIHAIPGQGDGYMGN